MKERVNPVQVQKFLKGIDYPAKKEDVVRVAREHGADEKVVTTLQSLRVKQFNSPNDVSEAIGKLSG